MMIVNLMLDNHVIGELRTIVKITWLAAKDETNCATIEGALASGNISKIRKIETRMLH